MRKISIILLIGFCFASCRDKNALPAGILDREKMRAVLWDVIRAAAFTNDFIKKDTTKDLVLEDAKLQHEIFAIHQVTKDEFYTSYDYYKVHPQLMTALLDSIELTNNRNGPPRPKGGIPFDKYPRNYSGEHFPGDHFPGGHFPGQRPPFFKDSLDRLRPDHIPH